MIGWIAIYRCITEHWVWNTSSRRFQRWVDLLFLASWKERDVGFGNKVFHLNRGQIVTSVRQLMSRWRTNNSTVTKTLKIFEDNGMIVCDRRRNETIITVVNYNKYQRFASLAQSLADEQQLMDDSTQESDDYLRQNPTQKVTDERHIRVHKQIPIEQDNNINNKQKIDADARAEEVLNDLLIQPKVEKGCMAYHINPDEYRALAEEIINDWLTKNEKDWSWQHFWNTLRIKAEISRKKMKNDGNSTRSNQESNNAGGGESNPLSRARVHRADTSH